MIVNQGFVASCFLHSKGDYLLPVPHAFGSSSTLGRSHNLKAPEPQCLFFGSEVHVHIIPTAL